MASSDTSSCGDGHLGVHRPLKRASFGRHFVVICFGGRFFLPVVVLCAGVILGWMFFSSLLTETTAPAPSEALDKNREESGNASVVLGSGVPSVSISGAEGSQVIDLPSVAVPTPKAPALEGEVSLSPVHGVKAPDTASALGAADGPDGSSSRMGEEDGVSARSRLDGSAVSAPGVRQEDGVSVRKIPDTPPPPGAVPLDSLPLSSDEGWGGDEKGSP